MQKASETCRVLLQLLINSLSSCITLVLYIYKCVFVALHIQHAMRMRRIVICGLSLSAVFFHIISQRSRFKKKKLFNIGRVL